MIAHKVAKKIKPFSDGELIKECFVYSVAVPYLKKKDALENGKFEAKKKKADNFAFFSLALDESCDIYKYIYLYASIYMCYKQWLSKFNCEIFCILTFLALRVI